MSGDAPFTLRVYRRADDYEAAIRLHCELNRHEAALGAPRDTSREAAIQCLNEDTIKIRESGGEQLVAAIGQTVAGYAALLINRAGSFLPMDLRDHVHIETLVIDPAFRRRGIATAFLDRAEDLARLHGFRVVTLGVDIGNGAAVTAYTKAGFKPVSTEMAKLID